MKPELLSIDVNDVYKDKDDNQVYFIISNCSLYWDNRWYRGVTFRDEHGNIFTYQINDFLNKHVKL